jgi:hypothetical protein
MARGNRRALSSTPAIALAALGSVLALSQAAMGLPSLASSSSPASQTPNILKQSPTLLWSGVILQDDVYQYVHAVFKVPTPSMKCSVKGLLAIYVGIGGWQQTPFLQNGISVDAHGGVGVWYELFDSSKAYDPVSVSLTIKPGDTVELSARYQPSNNTILFIWNDRTRNQSVQRTITNGSRYLNTRTAEFVAESPRLPSFAPAFTTIPWTEAWGVNASGARINAVADAKHTANISDLVNALGQVAIKTQNVSGSSFTSTWQNCG